MSRKVKESDPNGWLLLIPASLSFTGGQVHARGDDFGAGFALVVTVLAPIGFAIWAAIRREMTPHGWLRVGTLLTWSCLGFLTGDADARNDQLAFYVGLVPTFFFPLALTVWQLEKGIQIRKGIKSRDPDDE